jgi:phage tail-like protein
MTKRIEIKIKNSWSPKETEAEISEEIDSGFPRGIWYNLRVNADIPEGVQIKTMYFVTDDPEKKPESNDWVVSKINEKDISLNQARGRYLLVKIVASVKDNLKVPTIRNIKVYFDREKYLECLPAVYQSDLFEEGFLRRYLSIFEDFNQKIEYQIENMSNIFDAQKTPSDFLPWLSSWVGAIKDENWPEDKWRIFLSRAVVLYRRRGTKIELEKILKIFTGKLPFSIVERALLKHENEDYKKTLDILYGDAYSFCVLLTADQVKTEKDQRVITRIIEAEKPAHTKGGFAIVEDRINLDWNTFLGINTYLVEPSAEMCVGEALLSINTVISD